MHCLPGNYFSRRLCRVLFQLPAYSYLGDCIADDIEKPVLEVSQASEMRPLNMTPDG